MASSLAKAGSGKGFLSGNWSGKRQMGRKEASFLRFKSSKENLQACLFSDRNGEPADTPSCHSIYMVDPFPYKEEPCKKPTEKKKNKTPEPVNLEKLDEWMNQSIPEIVRNIGEAPFLVHVYYEGNGSLSSEMKTRLERERAIADSWPHIRKRWNEGNSTPDGVILVEELKDEDLDIEYNRHFDCSRSWGIVVQGRGIDCPACYILKTDRVSSSVGFCTYFCLVRAKCYGESAELQLRSSWLQSKQ